MTQLTELTVASASEALRQGLGVAFPTPCGYGWAVDPFHPEASDRIGLLKPNRTQPVGLIAGNLEQVEAVTNCSAYHLGWFHRWPAELSLILPAKAHLPELIRSLQGGVSIRIPAGMQARALALAFGSALTATSLNRSGEPPACEIAQLAALPPGVITGYLPGDAGTSAPSTLVDLIGGNARVLRAGAVDVHTLLEG